MKEQYMQIAIEQAKIAEKKEEIPIGAVIVKDGKIIAKAFNNREKTNCAINHAEILAIKKACKKLKSWRLENCEIYVTLEPCLMCLGAIINARIKALYFGAKDNKSQNKDFLLSKNNSLNHNLIVEGGVLEEECSAILKNFFKKVR